MTNATKALVAIWINSVLALAVTFGVALSDAQLGAIGLAVNATLTLWVALTYKNSPKRIPDAPGAGSANG